MNKLQEILVVLDTMEDKPEVDVEFWRRRNKNGLNWRTYNRVSSKNFQRLCNALEDYKTFEVDSRSGGMIVSYYVK